MTWQPIETAPKDGTPILGWSKYAENDISIVRWEKRGFKTDWFCMADGMTSIEGQTDFGTDYLSIYVTHWMPLPKPPTDSDNQS